MTSALILLSGGLDSSTLLARAVDQGTAGMALSVFYGQRHARELDAARAVAAYYGVRHELLDMGGWGQLLHAPTDRPAVHAHYAGPATLATVVPNRNATLLCAAAGVAIATGCEVVQIAVHAADHPIHPDGRPEFIAALNTAILLGTDARVAIEAPFSSIDKTEIARLGSALDMPVERTWSCAEGGAAHCGRCTPCLERREALQLAGVPDPTMYVQCHPDCPDPPPETERTTTCE